MAGIRARLAQLEYEKMLQDGQIKGQQITTKAQIDAMKAAHDAQIKAQKVQSDAEIAAARATSEHVLRQQKLDNEHAIAQAKILTDVADQAGAAAGRSGDGSGLDGDRQAATKAHADTCQRRRQGPGRQDHRTAPTKDAARRQIMAILYITEYERLAIGGGEGLPMGAEPAKASQTVAIGGSTTQSAAFNAATSYIRVHTDAICSIAIGANPTATATTARLAAIRPSIFQFVAGDKIAVITNT